jgi:hypothetical protein
MSREVAEWLESPEGERWSRTFHEHAAWETYHQGAFADVKEDQAASWNSVEAFDNRYWAYPLDSGLYHVVAARGAIEWTVPWEPDLAFLVTRVTRRPFSPAGRLPVGLLDDRHSPGKRVPMISEADVFTRFGPAVNEVAEKTLRVFTPYAERDDIRQEAMTLLASYAGLMPGQHHGMISTAETLTGGDEAKLHHFVKHVLTLDLRRVIGRKVDREQKLGSLPVDELDPDSYPEDGFEDRVVSRLDADYDFRIAYPTLYRMCFGHQTEAEIAAADGVTTRAVKYRVAAEKTRAKEDPDLCSRASEIGIRMREEIPRGLTEDTAWEYSQSYRCPSCHAGATVTEGRVGIRHRPGCPRHRGAAQTRNTRRLGHVNFGPLARCELQRNGRGPFPGHCPWCDARTRTPALAAA